MDESGRYFELNWTAICMKLDVPGDKKWTVRKRLCGWSKRMKVNRSLWVQRTIQFQPLGPSTFGLSEPSRLMHDRPLSYIWTVHFDRLSGSSSTFKQLIVKISFKSAKCTKAGVWNYDLTANKCIKLTEIEEEITSENYQICDKPDFDYDIYDFSCPDTYATDQSRCQIG